MSFTGTTDFRRKERGQLSLGTPIHTRSWKRAAIFAVCLWYSYWPATREDLHRLRAVANVSYAEKRELMGPEHTYTHAHTPTPTYTHRSLADEILTLLVLLTRGPMSVPRCAWEWGALYFSWSRAGVGRANPEQEKPDHRLHIYMDYSYVMNFFCLL